MKAKYDSFLKALFITLVMIGLFSAEFTSAQGPDITIWYGDEQTFGDHGSKWSV